MEGTYPSAKALGYFQWRIFCDGNGSEVQGFRMLLGVYPIEDPRMHLEFFILKAEVILVEWSPGRP